jgi:hypothetical protein
MKAVCVLLALSVALCLAQVNTTTGLTLTDNFQGASFFNNFNFATYNDPTHGYVNYVDQPTAQSEGLIKAADGSATYIGCDHTNVASGRGRNSVRLESKKNWNNGLVIIDLNHMPTGCGTWPAFWMVGPNWPNGGEIDIIEGVDKQTQVLTTLHTSSGCDMSSEPTSDFTGHWSTGSQNNPSDNCYIGATDQYSNQGCSIVGAANSYGAPFNSASGGVFATNWVPSQGISVWFWPRSLIPPDIKGNNPNPAGWGKPYAFFQFGANCNSNHFTQNQMVFDLTFCGDWDGSAFPGDCPGDGSCQTFVQNNPSAFTEAYWSVNYVQVWQ